jgi:hypothetical protein
MECIEQESVPPIALVIWLKSFFAPANCFAAIFL